MKTNITLQSVKAAAEATILVAILVTVLTIGGELWNPLKDVLKGIFIHHWLGKGVLSIIVFILVYLIRKKAYTRTDSTIRTLYCAVIVSSIASLAMLLFFVLLFLRIV